MKARVIFSVLAASLLMLNLSVSAQTETSTPYGGADHPNLMKGFAADKLYQFSKFDNVNLFNGNVVLEVPLGNEYRVSSALSYRFVLTYNSSAWDQERNTHAPDPDVSCVWGDPYRPCKVYWWNVPLKRSNAGLGWALSFGRFLAPGEDETKNLIGVYESPDGGRHPFWPTLHDGEAAASAPVLGYTRDGTYLRLKDISGERHVEFPDGTVHVFRNYGSVPHAYRLYEMRDRYGNYVRFGYTEGTDASFSEKWTVSDSHGRNHVLLFESGLPSYPHRLKTVQLLRSGDPLNTPSAVFSLLYGDVNIPRPTPAPSLEEKWFVSLRINVPLLTTINLPASDVGSEKFDFQYYVDDLVSPVDDFLDPERKKPHTSGGVRDAGLLKSATLPTGARHEYSYSIWQTPFSECLSDFMIGDMLAVGQRKLVQSSPVSTEAVWTYVRTLTPQAAQIACGSISSGNPGYAIGPQEEAITSVTDPAGNVTDSYFSVWPSPYTGPNGFKKKEYGLPFSRFHQNNGTFLSSITKEQTCNPGCTQVEKRAQYVRYDIDPNEYDGAEGSNQRTAETRTIFLDDPADCTAASTCRYIDQSSSNFDGLGHYRITTASSNFTNASTRTSYTDYNPARGTYDPSGSSTFTPWPESSNWLLNSYTYAAQSEGGTTLASRACFDSTSGFLFGRRTLKNNASLANGVLSATLSDKDLLVLYDHTNGNVTSEKYYGGDLDALPTNVGLPCATPAAAPSANSTVRYELAHTYTAGSLATSRHVGVVGDVLDVDNDIYPATGLVNKTRDGAGVETTYLYDALGRLREASDATAKATLVYSAAAAATPATVDITIAAKPNNNVLSMKKYEFDGFGRVWKEHRTFSAASGMRWAIVETLYDSLGRVASKSEAGEGTPSPNKTNYTYDVFGRATIIAAPDGKLTTTQFTGTSASVRTQTVGTQVSGSEAAGYTVTETNVATTERYDAFGRLVAVEQDGGSFRADYAYDAADRLRRAVITAAASSPAEAQERIFTYDNRGFLTEEQHPESGRTVFAGYDSRGHSTEKFVGGVDSPFDLRFVYDSGERLTHVNARDPYMPNDFRPLKEFSYASSNDLTYNPPNLRKGKLEGATRHNYSPTLGDVIVMEGYGYNDVLGRPTIKVTFVDREQPGAGTERLQTFQTQYTYDDSLGVVTTWYPTCGSVGCTISSNQVSHLDKSFFSGALWSVGDYAFFSYWPSGALHLIEHSNGALSTYDQDSHGMARPERIRASYEGTCAAPVITLQPQSTSVVSGSSASFSVTATGTGLFQYEWYRVGYDTPVQTGSLSTYTTSPLTETTSYYVKVRNRCGNVMSQFVTATVTCAPPSIETNPVSARINSGGSVTLTVSARGSGTLSYRWYRGATGDRTSPITGATASSYTTGALTTTTKYWVEVTGSCAPTASSGTAVVTVPLPAPTSVVASRTTATQATVTWYAVAGGRKYYVERRSSGSQFTRVGEVPSTAAAGTQLSYPDALGAGANGFAYAYRVKAVDASNESESDPSNIDAVVMMQFSTITPRLTVVDDAHLNEILTAVNALRAVSGTPAATWTSILPAGTPVPAANGWILGQHIAALRQAMNEALQALEIATSSYEDPVLTEPGTVMVREKHMTDLQGRAK